ncbi:hypothetical protein ABW20_dc0101899 [Dactylellina cionopaga]|nr:hypothetical protein ABW20_dc0101899 [Dactylellina cionopaga]
MALRASFPDVPVPSEGQPPSKIDVRRLGPEHNPPSVEEIDRVLDLRHLIDYILHIGHEKQNLHIGCLQTNSHAPLPRVCTMPLEDESSPWQDSPETVDFKVYASMYRFFMVSAAMSKPYWEPFFSEDPRAARLRRVFASPLPFGQIDRSAPSVAESQLLNDEDLLYFRQFPCYNKNSVSLRDLDGVFGDLADYLVEKGQHEGIRSLGQIPSGTAHGGSKSKEEAGAIQSLMMLITCHEFFWRVAQRQLSRFSGSDDRLLTIHGTGIRYKKVPAIFLGIHAIVDIYIPANLADLQQHPNIQLDARPVGFGRDNRPLRQLRLLQIFQVLYRGVSPLIPWGGDTDLPFELGLFEYALRKHFDLRVSFSWGYTNTRYSTYMAEGMAFRGVRQFTGDLIGLLSQRFIVN